MLTLSEHMNLIIKKIPFSATEKVLDCTQITCTRVIFFFKPYQNILLNTRMELAAMKTQ